MQGKDHTDGIVVAVAGITPARAGKSHTLWGFRRRFLDHPRACGEKPEAESSQKVVKGSPPRMRGEAGRA